MNVRISLTVAALAASLALPSTALAEHGDGRRTTQEAKQQQLQVKASLRLVVVNERRQTWEWQDKASARRWPTRHLERHASIAYLHHLARLWHHRHHAAKVYYKRHILTSSYGNGNVALGQAMAARYGWVGGEWASLYELWNHESGWSTTSHNPHSDACGIPQAMNDCAYGYSAAAQIAWGLAYIKNRYGTPSAALGHWRSMNWY